ncbi:hypothetical protein PCANC_01830 [Puccinia coronata f. sp. avenae]|uniref:Uncharacterized protein n=1 Tax=Puccinia coronata f. sp. avenae TaxID=200324 RepID=A0A2N5W5C9_9BASI|nr:hypothetical protein PCASD_08803 [Puccinia coronata f. sp. avenae]PLW57423.1 hypothetical protein PCANC_01830 [Puccinia coronata f. sp. avenae]
MLALGELAEHHDGIFQPLNSSCYYLLNLAAPLLPLSKPVAHIKTSQSRQGPLSSLSSPTQYPPLPPYCKSPPDL